MQLPAARSRILKVGMTIIVGLVVVQYWLRGLPDFRHIEPLFIVNMTKDQSRPPWVQPGGSENLTAEGAGSDSTNTLYLPDSNTTLETNSTWHNASNATCPAVPPALRGRIEAMKSSMKPEEAEASLPQVELGGAYHPTECRARDRIAIIVPYRDREAHLTIFLYNMHHMLVRQQINYVIYIVEQEGSNAFNRGKLMNVGFVEANKDREFDCFIFHDVDLLPEDDRNLYTCPEQPRHMSVAVDTFKYKLPYKDLFGGVSALTKAHFELVNGFSNLFWGWGGEDDDISYRIRHAGLHISRYPPYIARYAMLSHNKAAPNRERFKLMQMSKKKHFTDGLNSLTYVRTKLEKFKLYTWILVDLQPPS